eukprot:8121100-Karenia_brevis.AAC.1
MHLISCTTAAPSLVLNNLFNRLRDRGLSSCKASASLRIHGHHPCHQHHSHHQHHSDCFYHQCHNNFHDFNQNQDQDHTHHHHENNQHQHHHQSHNPVNIIFTHDAWSALSSLSSPSMIHHSSHHHHHHYPQQMLND